MDNCTRAILLAEDNAINAKLVRLQLQKLGYQVHLVGNGSDAVIAATHHAYDAILMDCHMPEMDGLAATQAIRLAKSEHNKYLPIIALTANPQLEERNACIAAGMDDFLSKPVRIADLDAMLARWLKRADTSHEKQPVDPEVQPFEQLAVPDSAVLDPKAVRNLRMLAADQDPTFLATLVADFLVNTTMSLENLSAALATDETDTVRRLAHSLKSSSASYGAMELSALCRTLEFAERDRSVATGAVLLQQILDEFARVTKALEPFIVS